ncbi:staphylococcal nuclease domain-containing protein 1-like [Rhopilema esculentum]|uniref:staphylococcal nuclease domain-containing protein 1-like n=1 Tax=Rhopilema esculentum TaxID=499914 RepID=UPI0031D82898
MSQPQPQLHKGIVKQVLSGDCVIVRGQPKGGPPPEQQIAFSNVVAPKVGRRANPNIEGSLETKDEPYAWESREYLRSMLIGKEVSFTIEYKPPGSGRVYGSVFTKKSDGELVNLTESLVSEGLLEVRRGGIKPSDDQNKLIDLEEAAKAAKKGKWADDANEHVRNITWNVENPRNFVDQKRGKPVDAIIEMVRDGSTIRAFTLPNYDYVTVMMTGIKCPMYKLEGDKQTPEPFAEEAKFFTESRLLQREVKIIFEGVSNQNFLGSVIHPAGNIAELMLKEGFARCVDWSMGVLSSGHEKYRQAEKSAKQKQLRIWKGYAPSGNKMPIKDSEFTGKVVECINADAIVVVLPSKEYKKIFFSSLRPPRAMVKEDDTQENGPSRNGKRGKPLYDIPYMFEAREFLRKKLIGKKVDVKIDYVKPANDGYPERTCATVTIGGINIAEALISKGLATALRHRQDDDQRSSQYDDLLAAENRASKNGKGLHSKKEPPMHRVADISGDRAKAAQFLPFLQRAGKSSAIVEFVASGSRFRLYLPKETCQITFLLAGISCPKVRSVSPQGNLISEGEPFGAQALEYSKEHCMQREVEVQVENIDRAGNFIGWMFVDGHNLSADLVEHGLSKVHFTAERTEYFKDLTQRETKAKDSKLNMWQGFVEEKIDTVVEETERKTNFTTVVVTEISDGVTFWAQNVDTAERFEQMIMQLRNDLTSNPPLPGSFTPRKGDMCAGLFIDNLWYRVKVEKVDSLESVHVLYMDYGNRDVIPATKMANLPPAYHSFAAQAHEYTLACLIAPKDEDDRAMLSDAFKRQALNEKFLLNVEYRQNGQEFATLVNPSTKDDISSGLLADGLAMVEKRKEKRLQKILANYRKAQEEARSNRVNLWCYGDFTEDDAPEFGYR